MVTGRLNTFPCSHLSRRLYFAHKFHNECIQTNVENNFVIPHKGFAFTALTTKEHAKNTAITLACTVTTDVTKEFIGVFDGTREKRAGREKLLFILFFFLSPRESRACVASETPTSSFVTPVVQATITFATNNRRTQPQSNTSSALPQN